MTHLQLNYSRSQTADFSHVSNLGTRLQTLGKQNCHVTLLGVGLGVGLGAVMAELKHNLEQQIDEFELLQCMFSGPGEFQVEDESSYDQVIAFLRDLTPHSPGRLSFSVHILIDAQHQPLDSESELSSRDGSPAESKAVQHTVDISFRLPHRYGGYHYFCQGLKKLR